MRQPWENFKGTIWKEQIDVADFIQNNYKPYLGDESFLASATPRTLQLMEELKALLAKEHENNGVLAIDSNTVTSLLTFPAGYLNKEKELIVGLQTDQPLKRGINPFGGMRMAREACLAYGHDVSEKILTEFKYRTTHNDGVFRAYTPEMRAARSSGVITGLPDAYGRGRIIGDYRRVALYGVDHLIAEKQKDKLRLGNMLMDTDNIRLSEELFQQITFLTYLKEMAQMYGYDISLPATNAREAIQWVYFAYLGAIKEQNGAAMSLGRISTFLDIYIQRDIDCGILQEVDAQELMDDFVMKLRMARHLRTPEYNELFGGDPMWITESVGGMGLDGRTLVSRTSYRMLNTLYTLGAAPEPNLTVLWSENLPESFKRFCAKVSIDTDALQYENDDLMRPLYGDDYAIACCVSAMKIGKQMQFFGARCNLPKLLLLALNGGRDEISGKQIGPVGEIFSDATPLCYNDVMVAVEKYRTWLCNLYVNTMNIIHYMHDKYAYEKVQMGLHDTNVERIMAFGVSGLSVMVDSLSAIRYAKVTPVKNEMGLIGDFVIHGNYPQYGNDLDDVDHIAVEVVEQMYAQLCKTPTYRNAQHALSVLTITSNVMYGKKTGSTPDGRKRGEPFAPGANPMHNREHTGALASLNSVAKLPYHACRDGISNTFTIIPDALGKDEHTRISNLVSILEGYFKQNAHHININVMDKAKLLEAYEHPELYPNLTIRVSGYAVNFSKLNREQQREVIQRTFHSNI